MHPVAAFFVVLLSACWLEPDAQVKPLKPEEAADKVGQKVVVEFLVRSTGESRGNNKLFFLNSEKDFRSEKNFTVVIDGKLLEKFAKAGVADPKTYYINEVVRVSGTVSLYQNKPQIRVEGPEQIEVVRKAPTK
jgi:DNA/RNA endonuclease YhcR with UshA esterase domain